MPPDAAIAVGMSYAEYLTVQATSEQRLTWVAGEIFAMAGGTPEHAQLISQVLVELAIALRGSPCRAVAAEQRVRIAEHDMSVYPDVAVFCGPGERAADDRDALVNPTLIAEVLSPSTEAWDRGGRFQALQSLLSLQHYLLITPDRRLAELFTRNPDGSWTLRNHVGSGVISLPAIQVHLALDAIYAGVVDVAAPKDSAVR